MNSGYLKLFMFHHHFIYELDNHCETLVINFYGSNSVPRREEREICPIKYRGGRKCCSGARLEPQKGKCPPLLQCSGTTIADETPIFFLFLEVCFFFEKPLSGILKGDF